MRIHTCLTRVSDERHKKTNITHGIEHVLLREFRRAEPSEGFKEPFGCVAGVAREEIRVERSAGPRLTGGICRVAIVGRMAARMLSQTPRPMPRRA